MRERAPTNRFKGLRAGAALAAAFAVILTASAIPATAKERVIRAERGDTVYALSRRYGVAVTDIIRLNRLKTPYHLLVGQRVRLPGRTVQPAGLRPPKPGYGPAKAGNPPPVKASRRIAALHKTGELRMPALSGRGFAWPVQGRIVVGYGPRKGGWRSDGINIAARKGAPVRAAENGIVAYAGKGLATMGQLVLVKHAGGWVTAYAHNDRVLVRRGDTVRRGQTIAQVGQTGSVLSPQLHFEIRKGDTPTNPLARLR